MHQFCAGRVAPGLRPYCPRQGSASGSRHQPPCAAQRPQPGADDCRIVLADLITGSFFVETVAGVPGIGRYFVTAASGRDYPVLMALTLLYALLIIPANLAVDVGYGLLDPRVSFA